MHCPGTHNRFSRLPTPSRPLASLFASYEADIAATSEINRSAASGDGLREATALSCFGF
jgi:hypothetical protein